MKTKDPSISVSNPTVAEGNLVEDDPRAMVGQLVADRYEVQELLGVGGMGCVYRARHVHIRKQVALKMLHATMLRSPEAVARFEREAVAAARIDHPNVVVATDFGHLPSGRYYLVLELVEGRELRHEIDAHAPLSVPRVLAIGRQIASALAAAHPLGIVHRDLKPENVMLVQRGGNMDLVKVLDFGIAKITLEDSAQTLTQFGAVFGTPQYMSPEQAKGQVVDGRSDLYSLGLILYEMLTGKLPFEAADALGFIMQQLNAAPAPLPLQVPEPLRQLVQSLLEKDPGNRPASATDVKTELERQALLIRPTEPGTSQFKALLQRASRIGTKVKPVLKQPRRVGKVTLSTAGWLLLASSLLVASVLLLRHGAPIDTVSRTASDASTAAAAPSSALPALSNADSAREIGRIEQLKVYQRTERDWMLLARGSAQLSHFEQSVGAYQALLSLRRDFRKDKGLLADLLNASQDPKAFRMVLNLSETVLGKHGVDLIWEMWELERYQPDRKEQADKLAKKLVILSRQASPALRVAIELTFTTHCDRVLSILGRAATEADSRSNPRLAAMAKKTGCGLSQDDDCYPCLRDSQLLVQATDMAKKTRAPGLGETSED